MNETLAKIIAANMTAAERGDTKAAWVVLRAVELQARITAGML